jgi:hypothetical protein
MQIETLAAEILDIAERSARVDWDRYDALWNKLTLMVEMLLNTQVAGAFCVAQDWDNRLDCSVQLPDGSIVGERVGLRGMTADRLNETAIRLGRYRAGDPVELVNPIRPPLYIGSGRP